MGKYEVIYQDGDSGELVRVTATTEGLLKLHAEGKLVAVDVAEDAQEGNSD